MHESTIPEPARGDAGGSGAPEPPLVRIRGVIKRFPGVLAVDSMDLDVAGGEIMALLGQNGAGKSTLIQILAGVHQCDEGSLLLGDAPYRPSGVVDAERNGIVLIPQQVNVVPELSVGQNMYLNSEPTTRFGLIDWPRLYADARHALAEFGADLDPRERMGVLDLATQQLVVIARALSRNARVLILDEPTAALTESEAQRLFHHLRDLRERGVAIIYVSHRLAEVFALADRIVVMRDGRLRGDHRVGATTRDDIVREMLGAELGAAGPQRAAREVGSNALEISNLYVRDPDRDDRLRVDDLSLTVARGEIVGVFGLVGAGCGEVALAAFGAWPGRVTGKIAVDGQWARIRQPADAIAHGIGLLAPDRRQTLILEHPIADNLVLASLSTLGRRGLLDIHAKTMRAQSYARRLAIKAPSVQVPVGALSGGNQQKVQVGRWLAAQTRILLLVDPTHGVDVGARAEIYRLLAELAADGYAMLLVSAEAEELVAVCDRVLVLRAGRLVGEVAGPQLTESRLLHLAAGD